MVFLCNVCEEWNGVLVIRVVSVFIANTILLALLYLNCHYFKLHRPIFFWGKSCYMLDNLIFHQIHSPWIIVKCISKLYIPNCSWSLSMQPVHEFLTIHLNFWVHCLWHFNAPISVCFCGYYQNFLFLVFITGTFLLLLPRPFMS